MSRYSGSAFDHQQQADDGQTGEPTQLKKINLLNERTDFNERHCTNAQREKLELLTGEIKGDIESSRKQYNPILKKEKITKLREKYPVGYELFMAVYHDNRVVAKLSQDRIAAVPQGGRSSWSKFWNEEKTFSQDSLINDVDYFESVLSDIEDRAQIQFVVKHVEDKLNAQKCVLDECLYEVEMYQSNESLMRQTNTREIARIGETAATLKAGQNSLQEMVVHNADVLRDTTRDLSNRLDTTRVDLHDEIAESTRQAAANHQSLTLEVRETVRDRIRSIEEGTIKQQTEVVHINRSMAKMDAAHNQLANDVTSDRANFNRTNQVLDNKLEMEREKREQLDAKMQNDRITLERERHNREMLGLNLRQENAQLNSELRNQKDKMTKMEHKFKKVKTALYQTLERVLKYAAGIVLLFAILVFIVLNNQAFSQSPSSTSTTSVSPGVYREGNNNLPNFPKLS